MKNVAALLFSIFFVTQSFADTNVASNNDVHKIDIPGNSIGKAVLSEDRRFNGLITKAQKDTIYQLFYDSVSARLFLFDQGQVNLNYGTYPTESMSHDFRSPYKTIFL